MNKLTKFEIGTLVAIIVAVATFASLIGSITADIRNLKTNEKNKIEAAIEKNIGQLSPAPVGTIMAFAGKKGKIPEGWLLCDGVSLKTNKYPKLYEILGNTWGGDSAGVFYLPDFRGRFLRGVDYGAGRDNDATTRKESNVNGQVGDEVGSIQTHSTAIPHEAFTTNSNGSHVHTYQRFTPSVNDWKGGGKKRGGYVGVNKPINTGNNGIHVHSISSGGDSETRPKNVNVNWIIKIN